MASIAGRVRRKRGRHEADKGVVKAVTKVEAASKKQRVSNSQGCSNCGAWCSSGITTTSPPPSSAAATTTTAIVSHANDYKLALSAKVTTLCFQATDDCSSSSSSSNHGSKCNPSPDKVAANDKLILQTLAAVEAAGVALQCLDVTGFACSADGLHEALLQCPTTCDSLQVLRLGHGAARCHKGHGRGDRGDGRRAKAMIYNCLPMLPSLQDLALPSVPNLRGCWVTAITKSAPHLHRLCLSGTNQMGHKGLRVALNGKLAQLRELHGVGVRGVASSVAQVQLAVDELLAGRKAKLPRVSVIL